MLVMSTVPPQIREARYSSLSTSTYIDLASWGETVAYLQPGIRHEVSS